MLDWHVNSLNTYSNETRNMPKTVKLKMQLQIQRSYIQSVNNWQYSTSKNTNIMHKLFNTEIPFIASMQYTNVSDRRTDGYRPTAKTALIHTVVK